MKLKITPLFITYLVFLFCACQPSSTDTQTKFYFDVKGLIETQIKTLNALRPTVNKKLMVNGQAENQQTTITDWAKELELFKQMDINKPSYKQSYETISNDNIIEYRLKANEKLAVKFLKIQMDDTKKPMAIEAQIVIENQLYKSKKQLKVVFGKNIKGKWGIKTYEIHGFQHLSLTDAKPFEVSSEIKY